MSRPVVIAVASFTYADCDSRHSNCIDDLKSACFVPQHFADLVCESRGSSRGRYLYYQNFWILRMPFPTQVTRDPNAATVQVLQLVSSTRQRAEHVVNCSVL